MLRGINSFPYFSSAVSDTDGPSVIPQLQDATSQTDPDNEVKLLKLKLALSFVDRAACLKMIIAITPEAD